MAPITDIRQKKQSSTINVDELHVNSSKKYIDANSSTITTIGGPPLTSIKSRGKDQKMKSDLFMDNSFEKDTQF